MYILQKILAVIVSIILPFMPAASVIDFGDYDSAQATQREYLFDDEKLLLGAYNYNNAFTDKTHLDYIKDANLDFLICNVSDALVNYCEENGIGLIAHGVNAEGGWIHNYSNNRINSLTKENFKYADKKCFWGDSVIDEPDSTLYPALNDSLQHYYSLENKRLPLINLLPNYLSCEQSCIEYKQLTEMQETIHQTLSNTTSRKIVSFLTMNNIDLYNKVALLHASTDKHLNMYKEYISKYISEVDTDILCVDIYPLNQADTISGAFWLNNLDVLAEACKETGRKLWVITQVNGSTNPDVTSNRYCDNVEDIRYQIYVSLAFGAKSVIHACYQSGWWDKESNMIDQNGNRTASYYAVQQANKEAKAFADVYSGFDYVGTFLKNASGADGTNAYGFLQTTPDRKERGCEIKSKDHILAGVFEAKKGNSSAYTFVNMNGKYTGKAATATIKFDKAKSFTVYQKGVATTFEDNKLMLNLDVEEGVFVTVNK